MKECHNFSLKYALQILKDDMSKKSLIEDENAENIKNLERLIHLKGNNEIRLKEERNQYETMVFEQQKIIRLALARIVPNKNIQTKTQFCQVHFH